MAMQREFYIMKGAMKIAPKDLPVVFYVNREKLSAQCFIGRAQKPTWQFLFLSMEQMEKKIEAQIKAVKLREADRAARREQAKKPHGMEVGQILYSSWGYDQTNIDFYEVVSLVGKTMVKIERIGSQQANDSSDYGHGMAREVVPAPEHRTGEFFRSRVSRGGARGKHGYRATVWDGKPKYESWYA